MNDNLIYIIGFAVGIIFLSLVLVYHPESNKST